jgi:hypothetical protein
MEDVQLDQSTSAFASNTSLKQKRTIAKMTKHSAFGSNTSLEQKRTIAKMTKHKGKKINGNEKSI